MEIICKGCGNSFEGDGEKFCNNTCRDSHIDKLEKIMKKAVKNDPSHTENFSTD